MKKHKLICYSGIDGSGKTTLAKYSIEFLRAKNINSKFVYGRYQPICLRVLILFFRKLFLSNAINEKYSTFSDAKKKMTKKFLIFSRLYQLLLLMEYSLELGFRIQLPLLFGKKIIVCDRYIIDTIITDLAIDFHYSYEQIKALLLKMQRIFPEPSITFLIDLPEDIAFIRKNDTPSINYLIERRKLYRQIAHEFGYTIVDGTRPIDEIKVQINKVIESQI